MSETPLSERRFGRFRVSDSLLKGKRIDWDTMLAVFEGMVILRAEHLVADDCMEYTAASAHFDPVPIAMISPEYVAVVTRGINVVSVKWERLAGAEFFDQIGRTA